MPHPCECGVSFHVLIGLRTESRLEHRIGHSFRRTQCLNERVLVAPNVVFEINDADLAKLSVFQIQEFLLRNPSATMIPVLVVVLPAVRLLDALKSGHRADAVGDDQDAPAVFADPAVFRRESREVRLPGQISRFGFEPSRDDVGHGRQSSAFAGKLHGLLPGSRKAVLVIKSHRAR